MYHTSCILSNLCNSKFRTVGLTDMLSLALAVCLMASTIPYGRCGIVKRKRDSGWHNTSPIPGMCIWTLDCNVGVMASDYIGHDFEDYGVSIGHCKIRWTYIHATSVKKNKTICELLHRTWLWFSHSLAQFKHTRPQLDWLVCLTERQGALPASNDYVFCCARVASPRYYHCRLSITVV